LEKRIGKENVKFFEEASYTLKFRKDKASIRFSTPYFIPRGKEEQNNINFKMKPFD
jgi:hypothetical protein